MKSRNWTLAMDINKHSLFMDAIEKLCDSVQHSYFILRIYSYVHFFHCTSNKTLTHFIHIQFHLCRRTFVLNVFMRVFQRSDIIR